MSRYIDADKLQEDFKELHGGKRSLLIDTAPTADVVEVVRCKDCKHRYTWTDVNGCLYHSCARRLDAPGYDSCVCISDFCSYGERAEE